MPTGRKIVCQDSSDPLVTQEQFLRYDVQSRRIGDRGRQLIH